MNEDTHHCDGPIPAVATSESSRRGSVLSYAEAVGSVSKACREFEVPRATFYRWKRRFDREGESGPGHVVPLSRLDQRRVLRPGVRDELTRQGGT
jgi:transposase-like protein